MSLQFDDTVAALASAPGSAARGIIRLSGPDVHSILLRVISSEGLKTSSQIPLRFLGDFLSNDDFPALPVEVMFWPTQRSYTGQPLAELHTAGSPPLLEHTLSELFRQGVRPARPGEFTLRAFLAGRLDLMQAEAVLGVIDAQDHQELETALKQLGGGLSGLMAEVRSDLLDLLADLEAGLDFVEEDIDFVHRDDLLARLTTAFHRIGTLSKQAESRMQSTGHSRVVLAGLPNAGKSCLFNALIGEDAAIVSPIQGTTRDVLRVATQWNGVGVELVDTAGWEIAPQHIMQQADQQRREHSTTADLLLYCLASDMSSEDEELNTNLRREIHEQRIPMLQVLTKSDLSPGFPEFVQESPAVCVSAVTGAGVEELKALVAKSLSQTSTGGRQLIGTTAARCQESLTAAAESLQEALNAATHLMGDEIIAVELRQALEHLGRILGTVFTDDILDRIFSKFCIGK